MEDILFGSTNKPTSSVIISVIPPTLLPMTGFPQANASIKTKPKLSENEGKIKTSQLGMIFSTSFLAPVNITSRMFSSSTFFLSFLNSGPSPTMTK